jgi:hypothetical protein
VAGISRQLAAWPGLSQPERELRARPLADALYHVLAASLLLAEGEVLCARSGDFRKFLAAALYVRKWIRPPVHEPLFTTRQLKWLEALVDWTPVPVQALADVG